MKNKKTNPPRSFYFLSNNTNGLRLDDISTRLEKNDQNLPIVERDTPPVEGVIRVRDVNFLCDIYNH